MLRCIQLGKKGLGTTAPNPMVGCVLVVDDTIIGEGFTSPFGGSHAEVNALNSVPVKSLLKQATLYVSLEPCSHHGKTPPCVDTIIEHNLQRVVIGTKDPNPKVAGKGVAKLKEAGIEVTFGVLEPECRWYLRRFLTYHTKKRPYIILKWAQSQDGFMAPEPALRDDTPQPYWISNEYSQQLVHKWRSEEQAILIGTQTAVRDNPSLTTRLWAGKNPVRVVIDRNLSVPKNAKLFDHMAKTLVITEVDDTSQYLKGIAYERIEFGKSLPLELCKLFYKLEYTSIFIEGGPTTLESFIKSQLWDEARIFKSEICFKKGLKAPQIAGTFIQSEKIEKDELLIIKND